MTPTTPELRPDDFRPYDLPDTLDTNIPTRRVPGEPGIHWVARGLLAETCARCSAGRAASTCSTTRTPSSSTP